MTNYWVLQGNPKKWDRPDRLFSEPILGWCVTGVARHVQVGDGVLIWMANPDPERRGVHAAGRIAGEPWVGDQVAGARRLAPFAPLAIHWYLVHHPVGVEELRGSAFAAHRIIRMPRQTAYPCSRAEFDAVINLMREHGPTALPVSPAADLSTWWDVD